MSTIINGNGTITIDGVTHPGPEPAIKQLAQWYDDNGFSLGENILDYVAMLDIPVWRFVEDLCLDIEAAEHQDGDPDPADAELYAEAYARAELLLTLLRDLLDRVEAEAAAARAMDVRAWARDR